MYKPFSIVFFFSFLFISCNDDDAALPPEESEVEQTEVEENFYALTLNNSWTYSLEEYNATTQAYEAKDLLITNTITGTAVFDNETYYTITSSTAGTYTCDICVAQIGNMHVRDSLGYLITRNGAILFSKDNAEEYIISEEDWGTVYGVLLADNAQIESPAGTFNTVQNDRYAILANGETSLGRDTRSQEAEIGLVQKSIAYTSNPIPAWILTLSSYDVN